MKEEQKERRVRGSSGRSRPVSRGYSYGSCAWVMSEDRLSGREVNKIKKWIVDKEKWKRRNNIVMKGVNIDR